MSNMVQACPECDEAALTLRHGHAGNGYEPPEYRYRCENCGELTNDPVERESKQNPTITICPECGNFDFNRRKVVRPEFYCGDCDTEFDDPDTRPREPGLNSGTAKTLWELDADAVLSEAHQGEES